MDATKISEALRKTVDPNFTKDANQYLDSVQKIIGFAPLVLEVVMLPDMDPAVRQAGVIYLKNLVHRSWEASEDATQFSIHEQDRHVIRQHIVKAITEAPEPIRIQLGAMVATMVKQDFPGRWPEVVDQISAGLDTSDAQAWAGALLTLYRLVKVYEYKKNSERAPLTEAMKILLPVLYERMTALMANESAEAVFLQKLVLKILYALVQFSLNFQMLTLEDFGKWLVLVKTVVDRDVPAETETVDEEERPELIWWKAKKWAMHLLARIFERYGSPGQVSGQYKEFAELYMKRYAAGAIESALKVCFRKKEHQYVSPRVLNQALVYLQNAVSHASSWKHIRPHFDQLILDVVFPLLCYSEGDESLWEDDPAEYIKAKYDIFEDLISPESSAGSFLSAAMKRKGELAKTVQFIIQVLNSAEATPRQLDGGLRMVGILAPNLLKKKLYRKELESMLRSHVLPRSLPTQDKFLRARAMWVVQSLSEAPLSGVGLGEVVAATVRCLLEETEMPIQVEAAIAIQLLLADQPKAEALVRPHITSIIPSLMRLLASCESDDLTTVLDRLLSTYPAEITPIAVETAQGLAGLFKEIVNSESMEDRSVAAMGILGTLESVISVMEDHKEIMLHLEGIVLEVIKVVFEGTFMDFYEEIMSLIESLTTSGVSAPMWEVYTALYNMFKLEGMDFFMDMMPCLHNYLTVDTPAFLAVPQRLQMMLEMCSEILSENESSSWGEDAECHAGKLLECVVLQCGESIHQLLPSILGLALTRLARQVDTSELRTMMIQVLIAGLHSGPALTLRTLGVNQEVLNKFLAQWISDTDCFFGIHDRKLSILGLCRLVGLGAAERPPVLGGEDLAPKLLPSLLLLFDGLEKAYRAEAEMQNAETDSEESDDEGGDDGLASDEDEVDEEAAEYLARLSRKEKGDGGGGGDSGRVTGDLGGEDGESWSDDDEDGEWDFDENELEMYDTPLDKEGAVDEYILFKETMARIGASEPAWYARLTANLSSEQQKELTKVVHLADQRLAARASKAIESGGGYDFSNAAVPNTFNFGS